MYSIHELKGKTGTKRRCFCRRYQCWFILFSYQCSLLLFPTACIFYHIFKSLSTTFFIFLCCLSNATTLISYHVCHCLSTTFFILFRKYRAEKEGFEPSRRSTRPIPLAGAPLRPLEYFSRYFLYKITSLRDALFILLKTVLFVNLFFNFYYISDANFLIDVSYRLFPS